MITPRYHLVSLIAVFVALTFGVVLGSGLLSGRLLSGLQDEKQQLRAQITDLRDQQQRVDEKLGAANDFDTQLAGRMVHDAIAGKSVVIFRTPDADDGDVDAVSRLIGQAAGTVTATIALTPQFVDGNSAEKLRAVVESGIVPAGARLSTDLVDQGAQAGDLLGIALLINSGHPDPAAPPVSDAQRETVLAALRDTGFLTFPDPHVGAANAAVVITGGTLPEDAGNAGTGVARFTAALVPHGSGAVLAGRDGCAAGTAAVAVARGAAALTGVISTIDNVDAESGRITAVLAVGDLIRGGHPAGYGIGPGAGSVTVKQ